MLFTKKSLFVYFFDSKNFDIVAGFTLNCWNAWCFSCP